jgi:hypothetical protein
MAPPKREIAQPSDDGLVPIRINGITRRVKVETIRRSLAERAEARRRKERDKREPDS